MIFNVTMGGDIHGDNCVSQLHRALLTVDVFLLFWGKEFQL